MKPKLRSKQHKLWLVGQRMKKLELTMPLPHRSASCPPGERDLIVKNKDKERKSEVDDGESHVLVHKGREGLFPRECATSFLSIFGP